MLARQLEIRQRIDMRDDEIFASGTMCWYFRRHLQGSHINVRVDPSLPPNVVVVSPTMYRDLSVTV